MVTIDRPKNRYIKHKNNNYLPIVLLSIITLFIIIIVKSISAETSKISSSDLVSETTASSEEAVIVNLSSHQGVVRSSEVDIPKELETIILSFMDTQFESLSVLSSGNLTDYFDLGDIESYASAQINQTALDFLIKLRTLQTNDLTITSYSYGITFSDMTTCENGDVQVTLLEDNRICFAFLNGIESCSTGIEHSFIFSATSRGYKLVSHEKVEDVYSLIEDVYLAVIDGNYSKSETASFDEVDAILSAISGDLIKDAKSNLNEISQQLADYMADPESYENPNISWEVDYDREAAVAYAMEWVDQTAVIRNENKFASYDDLGGNCNNFVSQCILAGGIPMDTIGTIGLQWKWYGDHIGYSQSQKGRSPSWAGVNEFFEYCTYNEDYGMVAWTGDNIFSAQVGDVLQFGANDTWKHSVIITEIIYDDNRNPVDFLINSNTTDRINYPASAYAYSNLRLIRILGYNTNLG